MLVKATNNRNAESGNEDADDFEGILYNDPPNLHACDNILIQIQLSSVTSWVVRPVNPIITIFKDSSSQRKKHQTRSHFVQLVQQPISLIYPAPTQKISL